MREIIAGAKKTGQKAPAATDPVTNRLVVKSEAIRKVTLDYCLNTLTNNEPNYDVKESVTINEDLLKQNIQ